MEINFLYTADNVYFDLMRLSMISAVKFHKGAVFHVFTMDSPETRQVQISIKNKQKLEREITYLDPIAKIIFYDVRETYLQRLADSVNKGSKFTPYAVLRLLAPYIIHDVDMPLYLDADAVVVNSLCELFIDHEGKDFDFAATNNIYRYPVPDYFVFLSWLLLLNLRYQRQTGYQFMNDAIRHYNSTVYPFPDQDALSAATPVARIILDGRHLQYV